LIKRQLFLFLMNLQQEEGENSNQINQTTGNNRKNRRKIAKSKKEYLSKIRGRDLKYEEEKREKERMRKRRNHQRPFTATQSSDSGLLRKGNSWMFPTSPEASPV